MSKRDIFVEKLKGQLDEWNAEVDRLEAKASKIDAQSRARYRAYLQEIAGNIQRMEKQLATIKNSSADAWQELKAGAESAWKDFEQSVKRARDEFTKFIDR